MRSVARFAVPFAAAAMLAAQASWHDPSFLVPSSGAIGAHDPGRGLTYLLGGISDAGRLDLWAFDGTAWQLAAPAPFVGTAGSLAFDVARDRLVAVLHAGANHWLAELQGATWNLVRTLPQSYGVLAYDTTRQHMLLLTQPITQPPAQLWRWDGVALTPLGAPTVPAGWFAYDSARHRAVVLHWTGTYEWDGANWTAALPLPPGSHYALVYDPTVARIVVYGKDTFVRIGNDQWEWNGVIWTLRAPAGAPMRRQPLLVGETGRQRLLLYGGNDVWQRGDTWSFDGTLWRQVVADSGGPPLYGAGAAEDGQGRLLFFGGRAPEQPTDDTWVHANDTWTRLSPAHAPPARTNHRLAADPRSGRVFLFGGLADGTEFGDTWCFDGSDWQPLPPGPPPRHDPGLCFDDARGKLVLYGGRIGAHGRADTWEYDDRQWHLRIDAFPPNDGFIHLAHDRRRQRSVLVTKGYDELQTWEWDGSFWFATNAPQRPPISEHGALVYEPIRQRVMLVQGAGALRGYCDRCATWEWDGGTWRQVAYDERLDRTGMAVAYVAARGVVAYGGQSDEYVYLTHAIELRNDHPAAAITFGSACAGSAGMPQLAASGPPWLGDEVTFTAAPVAANAFAVLATGFSATSHQGIPLPLDLGQFGHPGCWLHVGPEAATWSGVLAGAARASLRVPADPALLGQVFFEQAVVLEPSAAAVATSNALRLTAGRR